jgi:predicted TIM-barrel fold metal-dependent hydrolase
MRRAGVTLQILSHAPGLSSADPRHCAQVNDFLAAQIRATDASRSLYRGLAVLPMVSPVHAARELRRCVAELGFVGAMIDNHISSADGSGSATHYDGAEFLPVFAAAEELDVPIYIHPMFPPPTLATQYSAGAFAAGAGASMGSSGWGWHSECGLHVLRLFAAGVFDSCPKLKIIVGHFGEMLPFMLDRVYALSVRWGARQRDFRTVWRENMWITTSGVWSVDPMAMIARNTETDKVLFSIDWPFADAGDGKKFWEDLAQSGLYDEAGLAKIGWRNAAKLFRLDEDEVEAAAERFEKENSKE